MVISCLTARFTHNFIALVSGTSNLASVRLCMVVSHSGGRKIPGCRSQSQEDRRGTVSAPVLIGKLWSFRNSALAVYFEGSSDLRGRSVWWVTRHTNGGRCVASDEYFRLNTAPT